MIDYLLGNVWQLWLFLAVVCLIVELSSGTFYILCFAIGAVIAGVASALGGGLVVQILTFAVASAVCIFTVRPLAVRYLPGHKGKVRASNADALIGREGRVSETIAEGGYGRVAIDGDDWKAVSIDGKQIERDMKVRVVSMDSIIITVERI